MEKEVLEAARVVLRRYDFGDIQHRAGGEALETLNVAVSRLDIIIILASLAVVLSVGFYYYKFAKRSSENYFLGGRGLPGWANGISLAATCMNSDVPPAYCGMMAATGLYLSWWYLSRFGLAFFIAGILFGPFWRRLRLFTAPEYYSLRYGGSIGSVMRVWTASRSAFIGAVAWTGAGILGIHKIAGQLFRWKLSTTILIVIPFVFFYVYISGYKGVVSTDIIQSLIMIAANIILAVAVLDYFGGPVALGRKLVTAFGPSVVGNLPPPNDERLGIMALLAWVLGTSIGAGGDISSAGGPAEGQRILSCKSERDAAWMYFTTEISLFILLVILTLPALGGILLWPDLHTLAYTPGHDPELIYGRMLGQFLGPGLLGFVLAGLIASVMSTVSANLNASGQVVANDVYRYIFHQKATERQMIRVGRIVMAVICVLAAVIALKAKIIFSVAVFMLGISSAELSANWAQWWWWRFNRYGRLAATFGGPLIFLAAQFFWSNIMQVKSMFRRGYLAALTGIVLTTVLWIVVTLCTKPDDLGLLEDFYRKARPMGFWGPVKKACGQEDVPEPRRPIFRGFLLSALGFSAIVGLMLGISDFYVGKFGRGAAMVAGFVVLGALFLRAFNRYFSDISGRSSSLIT
jgi:Na+/proline symporter